MKIILAVAFALQLSCALVSPAADRTDNSLSTAKASKPASDNGAVVIFSGTKYFLRTAKDDEYVFTPDEQEDLQQWTDMIRLSYYPEITDGKSLAAKAIAWWEHYRKTRTRIFKINFIPRLDQMPAHDDALYTAVTISEKPYNDYDEFSYTAVRIVEGIGMALVYSHREHRDHLIEMGINNTWILRNERLEDAWFTWNGIPQYRTLKANRPPEPTPSAVP
jgi:hypothetical protein